MLRWTRAWRLPHAGLGFSSPSFTRVPVTPSSSRGRGGAEPRPLPLSYRLLDGDAALPAVVFLHGLFGSKTNFNSIAKALAQQTGRRVSVGASQCLGACTLPMKGPAPACSPGMTENSPPLMAAHSSELRLLEISWSLLPSILQNGHSASPALQEMWSQPWGLLFFGRVLTVDARNHGDSPHSLDMSYEIMSQDLQDLLPQLGLVPCVIVGHSMGGKTAMLLALQRPELVERLIAVDISPVETTGVSNFATYVTAMRTINIPDELPRSRARKLADEQLSSVVQDMAVRQFLLTNLVEVDGRFVWRVNLDALTQHLDKILAFPQRQESYLGPTLFLCGGNSQFVQTSSSWASTACSRALHVCSSASTARFLSRAHSAPFPPSP
ncbi:sn-1-specific diacylglycerol lipase ABHD11 isoform X1 [Saimiri boliviensis]|uniref:sn-1-specific diacylglycerol lipase ABHD11 isoform X1 n=1 Tax=Saimiri boliviensis TaxID=27679 RepID=UPI000533CDFA